MSPSFRVRVSVLSGLAVAACFGVALWLDPNPASRGPGLDGISHQDPLASPRAAASPFRPSPVPAVPSSMEVRSKMLALPLRFERNDGQFQESVRFLARTEGMSLALEDEGPVLRLQGAARRKPKAAGAKDHARLPGLPKLVANDAVSADAVTHEPAQVLRMRVHNARPEAKLEASDELETKTNYFLGNDPAKWRSKVPNYGRVTYRGILPGTDLVYHGNGSELEYDFVVAPGASPEAISVHYDGASALSKTAGGELEVQLGAAKLVQHKPIAYQEIDGKRHMVEASFRILGDTRAGFEVATYDRSRPLVIDPVLIFATYLGGANDERIYPMALTASNQIAVAGYTVSANFPTAAALDSTHNVGAISDGFISLLNASGTALIFSTYIGGSAFDIVLGLAIDSAGAFVACGRTDSNNFPVQSAYDSAISGTSDGFVLKLQSDGSALAFSTYMGGSGGEVFYAVALDASNNIYVGGYTGSTTFPVTAGVFQPARAPMNDSVVVKMAADGSSLVYSTYLGGNGHDFTYAIAVRPNGNAIVAGVTKSTTFPIASAYQNARAGLDEMFLTELNATGSALVFSTYLGGTANERIGVDKIGLALDASGSIYLAAATESSNFPTTVGAYDTTLNGVSDGFVTKFAADGGSLSYSTLIGGASDDYVSDVRVDSTGRVLLTGITASVDFPLVQALQSTGSAAMDFYDGYLAVLDSAGTSLAFSTLLGGSGDDYGMGLVLAPTGRILVSSLCSAGFTTTAGSLQTVAGGLGDACISLYSLLTVSPSTKSVVIGESVVFTGSGSPAPLTWSLATNGSGGSHTGGNYTAGLTAGTDVLRLTDTITNDTIDATITVFPLLTLTPANRSVLPMTAISFAAGGGTGSNVFSLPTNNSGATLDAGTGAYVAGSTPGMADVVRVTDSEGHTVDVNVAVTNNPLTITPAAIGVVPKGSTTFVASGGTGTGYTFTVTSSSPHGSIGMSSGVYTAGATGSVVDTVALQDSFGSIVTATVTLSAGVTLAPASASLPYAGTQGFSAVGGNGTYSFSISTNSSGGSIDSSTGAYASGPTGGVTDTVTATDSLGNTSSASIVIAAAPPIALSPASLSIAPRAAQVFVASGGGGVFSGYSYTMLTNSSGGSIGLGSGLYTAGTTGNVTDVVRAADGSGNSITASISVTAGLSVSPTSAAVPYGGTQSFVASGGSGTGYMFVLSTNVSQGSVGTISGVYAPGPRGDSSDVVTVSDSLGNSAMANATVGASSLALAPANPTLAPRGLQTFAAIGGSGAGYVFTLGTNNSGGSIGVSTGAYLAGTTPSVSDVVQVSDSVGNTATTQVTVTTGVTISPAAPAIAPKGSQTFVASGGSGSGYHFALTGNSSGGSVGDSSGIYTAGTTGSVMDTVTATDALGNVATAQVAVGPAVIVTSDVASVAPRGAQIIHASLGSGIGFSFALSVNGSGGSIDDQSGQYNAGNTGDTTDVIRAIDSLGNVGFTSVAVTSGVSLTPASASLAPGETVAFSANGGSAAGFYFSLTTNASGGTIHPDTGDYAAGRTSDVTDVIEVVDSLGNLASANIAIGAGVALSPATATLAPRARQDFGAVGGSDSGYSFALLHNNSAGSIEATTGTYFAGPTGSVVDTVIVTDSVGNTATALLNIGPIVSLAPASSTRAPLGELTLSVTGGSGTGFTYSLSTQGSGGSVDPHTGFYAAGPLGNTLDVVLVTDSLGNTASANIALTAALAVAPITRTVPPRGSQIFVASAGAGDYAFAITSNGSSGSVSSTSGAYIAGSVPNSSDTVTVTDANGATVTALVSVGPGITITVDTTTVAPTGTASFGASGGSGTGFTFALTTNHSGALIDPTTGSYTAGNTDDVSDVVRVTDSLGNNASLSISIGAGVSLNPPAPSLSPRRAQTFAATGGSGTGFAFVLTTNASGGSIDPSSGAYTAGSVGDTTDIVTTTDSLGNFATATISVGPGVTLSPASLALPPGASETFSVSGGSGAAYAFSLPTNGSGSTIDGNGTYTAGSAGGTVDVVRVEDSLGNSTQATVTISAGVSISPTLAFAPPRGVIMFSGLGGSGTGYSFALTSNPSGGNIVASTGTYTAGENASTSDVVTVTDSLGNTASVSVAVADALTIEPASPSLPPRASLTFSTTGGSGQGLVFTIVDDQSGADIDASSGRYTAGSTSGVADLVSVTDSLGNTASVSVAIGAALSANPPASNVPPRGVQTIVASGGLGRDFLYELTTDGSGAEVSSSGVYTAGVTGGTTDVVTVRDALGNTALVTIHVGPNVSVMAEHPSLAPRGTTTFIAAGGAGDYMFALTTNASSGTIDASSGSYHAGNTGSVTDVITVTDSLGNTGSASVNVGPVLSLDSTSYTAPPRGRLTLKAKGGASDYRFKLTKNPSGGSVDARSGEYIAGSTGDVDDEVQASDADGVMLTATIAVGPAITISPTPDDIVPAATIEFTATGGSGEGYTWALLTENAGTLDASGVYEPGSKVPTGDVLIEVTDSLGNTARVTFRLPASISVIRGSGCSCDTTPFGSQGFAWPTLLVVLALAACARRIKRSRR